MAEESQKSQEPKTPSVEEQLVEMRKMLDTQSKQLETYKADNDVLRKSLDKQTAAKQPEEPPKTPSDVFTVAGRKYKFIVPRLRVATESGSEVISAVDALADKDFLAQLVKSGSGCIVEVAK